LLDSADISDDSGEHRSAPDPSDAVSLARAASCGKPRGGSAIFVLVSRLKNG
jgi:hypothetical protein